MLLWKNKRYMWLTFLSILNSYSSLSCQFLSLHIIWKISYLFILYQVLFIMIIIVMFYLYYWYIYLLHLSNLSFPPSNRTPISKIFSFSNAVIFSGLQTIIFHLVHWISNRLFPVAHLTRIRRTIVSFQ